MQRYTDTDANRKTRSAEPIDQILIDKPSGWAVLLYFWAIYLACALLSKFVWHFIDLIVAIWLAIIASLTAISGGRKTELRHKSIMTGHRRECIYNGDEGLSILAMDVYKFARIQTFLYLSINSAPIFLWLLLKMVVNCAQKITDRFIGWDRPTDTAT